MIAFRNFALRRGERLLLSNVDLALHAGARVGVVGRNGCGKSSLFAAIQGEIEPDKGDLDLPARLRIASVAQETPSLPDPAIDFVVSRRCRSARDPRGGGRGDGRRGLGSGRAGAPAAWPRSTATTPNARAGRLLHGLGFPAETHASRCPISPAAGACA